MTKTIPCVDCRVEFSYEHVTGPTRQRCAPCRTARKRQTDRAKSERWRTTNPELQQMYARRSHEKRKTQPGWLQYGRDANLKYKYGITRAELVALDAAQNGRCAICGGPPNGPGTRLHVDHCHDTGRIRGLLCGKCNTAVGLLDDSPERAEQLAAYLRR